MTLKTKPELIVKAKKSYSSTFLKGSSPAIFSADLLTKLINIDIKLTPIVKPKPLREMSPDLINLEYNIIEIGTFFKVDVGEERLYEAMELLNKSEEIEAAYIKPPSEPATLRINNMRPTVDSSAPTLPTNLRNRQLYLNPSPIGIDVEQAWNLPGGKGKGINIIDIEWGWRFTHEDLSLNQGGVISGPNSASDNHGTAVLGVFSGDDNSFGVVGISPDANVSAISLENNFNTTSEAIILAADKLQKGDIILIEVHRAGPQSHLGSNQFGYIGIEWWPDDFAAIQYAVQKGIIVVEAGGNGGQNLDDIVFNVRPVNDPFLGTFPDSWTNPFNMSMPQSGAVIVGAGLPPSGTHGRNEQPDFGDKYEDRGRCFFSNYGARIDVQGWGWEVTTTGYGDLQGGVNKDSWYTDQFSGTSSASPIIVGVLACLQGILKARGNALLGSIEAANLLRKSGALQQDAPGFTFLDNMAGSGYPQQHPPRSTQERIGNRPDLKELLTLI